MRIQPVFGDKVRNNSGRHKMRADGDMRIEFPNKFYQGPGIQAIEHQPHAIGLPWFIALFVPPAEKVWRGLYQTCVQLRVKVAEELVCEMQGVAVNHLAHSGISSKSLG